MYNNPDLITHLEEKSTIELGSMIYAEINMNDPDNIAKIGNYKNRIDDAALSQYDSVDAAKEYTGYTDSDIVVNGGVDETETPIAYASTQTKNNLFYSLEDCFKQFRPRSGINKAMYLDGNNLHFLHNVSEYMMQRPRYYVPDKDDKFKYWSSFRREADLTNKIEVERGIAKTPVPGSSENEFYIDDVAPFIVYKNAVPVNRIIIKIQTHVGTYDIGGIYDKTLNNLIDDPMYEAEDEVTNRSVPVNWKIQYLDSANNWQTAKSFTSAYSSPGVPLIGRDGYLELQYSNNTWNVGSDVVGPNTPVLSEFSIANLIESGQTNDYLNIKGLRLVVDTVSKKDYTFDLIELSPRLAVDFTNIVTSYNINKVASDLGSSGLPVGTLAASTGSITFADYDRIFSPVNTDSILSNKLERNVQIKFFEIIKNVSVIEDEVETLTDFYVPVKTLYANKFPAINAATRNVTVELRDMFSYFEALTAPQIFIKNVSFSYAIAMLLDSVGFTNYVYKKSPNDNEPIIPDFFVPPNISVAEVLQDLAVSTQTAMFFDEENNLILMSRGYMLPGTGDRETDNADLILRGSYDNTNPNKLINIQDIKEETDKMFNAGKISYITRYIQKSTRTFNDQLMSMADRNWVYQPVILWDVPTESKFNVLQNGFTNDSYALSAIPLNTDLTNEIPYVDESNVIQNNTIDLGEGIYWLARNRGYFHSGGEIIQYDAVEYFVQGQPSLVWINSQEEYAEYFSKIPFNGKIYPTGKIRIYTEPYYLEDGATPKPGAVAKHGRGQFNTKIVNHYAGLSSDHWTQNNDNVGGMSVDAKYIFNDRYDSSWKVTTNKSSSSGSNIVKVSADEKLKVRKGQKITGTSIPDNTTVESISLENGFKISNNLTGSLPSGTDLKLTGKSISVASAIKTQKEATGKKFGSDLSKPLAEKSKRTSLIKNFLNNPFYTEDSLSSSQVTSPATAQSSALVFTGPTPPVGENGKNFMSYILKKDFAKPVEDGGVGLTGIPNHIGARMRIIGQYKADSTYQTLTGAYSVTSSKKNTYEAGVNSASGGIAFSVNDNNNGYFFEIAALSSLNIDQYGLDESLANLIFYKTVKKKGNDENDQAFPIRLWSGMANILADNGEFIGQYRLVNEEYTTVYDLAIEYKTTEQDGVVTKIEFLLYLNNNLVGRAIDTDPLNLVDNAGVFVRGASSCMFENFYAMTSNESANYINLSETPLEAGLNLNKEYVIEESYKKYAIPEAISSTYFDGISAIAPRKTDLFFDEFGTIFREVDYFNIRYDKAYPALSAIIAPTFNRLKGYVISGFVPNAYGAEFLVFNVSDRALSFDSNNNQQNWLRIIGTTFTQESNNSLTLDEYFAEHSNLSDANFFGQSSNENVVLNKENYQRIKNNIAKYGKTEFNIEAPYIQTGVLADSLMGWLVKNITLPRKSIGIETFGTQHLQLGDIVSLYYKDNQGNPIISDDDKKFVVYSIAYSKSLDKLSNTVYLSEVIA